MPYVIARRDDKFVVFRAGQDKRPVGKPLGTHPSRDSALRQIRAVQVSEAEKAREFRESDVSRDTEGQFAPTGGGGGNGNGEEVGEKPEAEAETQFIPKDEIRDQNEPPSDAIEPGRDLIWQFSLTDKEEIAMDDWAEGNWEQYQAIARGEDIDLTDANAKFANEHFSDFEAAVERAPTYNGVSWRGASARGQTPEEALSHFQNRTGDTFEFDTYTSSSASARIAGEYASQHDTPVIYETYSSQGHFVDSAFNQSGFLQEVMFSPGSNFVIRDAYMGQIRPTFEPGLLDAVVVVLEDSHG